jgi:hypothetical protein
VGAITKEANVPRTKTPTPDAPGITEDEAAALNADAGTDDHGETTGDQPTDQPTGDQPTGGQPKAEDAPKAAKIELSLDAIAAPYAVAAVESERTAPKHARNPMQQAMDAITLAVHQRWVDAGRPGAWLKMPKAKYAVPPEAAEAWRKLITNSGTFILDGTCRAKLGSPGSLCTGLDLDHQGTDEYNPCGECLKIEAGMVAANEEAEPDAKLEDEALVEAIKAATGGHELVVFSVLDKRPNVRRGNSEAKADEAAPEATPEDGNKEEPTE